MVALCVLSRILPNNLVQAKPVVDNLPHVVKCMKLRFRLKSTPIPCSCPIRKHASHKEPECRVSFSLCDSVTNFLSQTLGRTPLSYQLGTSRQRAAALLAAITSRIALRTLYSYRCSNTSTSLSGTKRPRPVQAGPASGAMQHPEWKAWRSCASLYAVCRVCSRAFAQLCQALTRRSWRASSSSHESMIQLQRVSSKGTKMIKDVLSMCLVCA